MKRKLWMANRAQAMKAKMVADEAKRAQKKDRATPALKLNITPVELDNFLVVDAEGFIIESMSGEYPAFSRLHDCVIPELHGAWKELKKILRPLTPIKIRAMSRRNDMLIPIRAEVTKISKALYTIKIWHGRAIELKERLKYVK